MGPEFEQIFVRIKTFTRNRIEGLLVILKLAWGPQDTVLDHAEIIAIFCPRGCLCVTQYRTTVAKMLAKQANDPRNPAQFIITTFHPQIIHETDKVYGVSHQNRISR